MPPHTGSGPWALQLPGLEEAFSLYLSELEEPKANSPVATVELEADGVDEEAWMNSFRSLGASQRQTVFSIPKASPRLQKNTSHLGSARNRSPDEPHWTQSAGDGGWEKRGPNDARAAVTVHIARTQRSPAPAEDPDADIRPVITKLTAVLEDVAQYKRLLKCGGDDAQRLLDLFQTVCMVFVEC